jgi:transcriptional regulator with XRE-family HTH domain
MAISLILERGFTMTFGEKLKQIRKSKGLGVNQLALKSGVSASQISRFENGKRKDPQMDTAKKLAKALDVSVSELIGNGDSQNVKENGPTLVAAHLDDDVSEEDMEDILKYIEFRKNNPLGKKK